MKNLMNDDEMQAKLKELNQQEEVDDAHIVTFMGEDHIHIDFTNGNIGVVSPDGSSISVVE